MEILKGSIFGQQNSNFTISLNCIHHTALYVNAFRSGIAIHKSKKFRNILSSTKQMESRHQWITNIFNGFCTFQTREKTPLLPFFLYMFFHFWRKTNFYAIDELMCRLAHLFPLATKILLKLITAWFHWSIDSMFCLLSTNVQKIFWIPIV